MLFLSVIIGCIMLLGFIISLMVTLVLFPSIRAAFNKAFLDSNVRIIFSNKHFIVNEGQVELMVLLSILTAVYATAVLGYFACAYTAILMPHPDWYIETLRMELRDTLRANKNTWQFSGIMLTICFIQTAIGARILRRHQA